MWDKATNALVRAGAASVDPLVAMLKDTNAAFRGTAVWALGEIRDARAFEPLLAALKDTDKGISRQAAISLGKLGDPRGVEPLVVLLWSDSDTAWRALREMPAAAGERLLAILRDRTNEPMVREMAIWALTASGLPTYPPPWQDPRLVDTLIAIARASDEDYLVRQKSVVALGELRDTRAVQPLIAILVREKGAGGACAEVPRALGMIGRASIEPLMRCLRNPERSVRRLAADALAAVGEPAVLPVLPLAKSADSSQRRTAAYILGEIGGATSRDLLAAALTNGDLALVAGAYRYYIRIGLEDSEELLVRALNALGEPGMAEDYLNSGNAYLAVNAREWAVRHGYNVSSQPQGSTPIKWGGK